MLFGFRPSGSGVPAFRRSANAFSCDAVALDGIYQVIMFMLLISGNVVDSYLVILLIIH